MEQYLEHHGILGMKWGVRRYQNPDGTLTTAGKARYREDGTKITLENMTDEEYDRAMKQMEREKKFKDMQKSTQTNGFGSGLSNDAAVALGVTLAGAAATIVLTQALSDDGIESGEKLARQVLLATGTTAIATLTSAYGGTAPNTNSSPGNSNSNSGNSKDNGGNSPNGRTQSEYWKSSVGSPSNRGQYTAEEEKLYQGLHQKYRDPVEKDTIRAMRKAGYDVSQITKHMANSTGR